MAYREETYVIDSEVNTEKQTVQKPMESVPVNDLQREYEIVEEEVNSPTDQMLQEIHDTAVAEGLVSEDEGFIGGEGAKPEEVINATVEFQSESNNYEGFLNLHYKDDVDGYVELQEMFRKFKTYIKDLPWYGVPSA